jgi:sugar phosphate isomerase/epimerase
VKLGLITDSLAAFGLDEVLDIAADAGIECLELGTGNWSSAPHVDVDHLLESSTARRELLDTVNGRGLAISALNCSGNQLAPGAGGRSHDEVVRKTLRLAGLLEVDRVVMMSGLPGGPGDANPNWIVAVWPPENLAILNYQWEIAVRYWADLVTEAQRCGVRQIALENHAYQLVYNPPTLLRLRDAVGEIVGANLDPSHAFWMGADPIAMVGALGEAIYHVHGKDAVVGAPAATRTMLETEPNEHVDSRAWSYVAVGRGHDQHWWHRFVASLRRAGYDDVVSIEHEDYSLDPQVGVRTSAQVLAAAIS